MLLAVLMQAAILFASLFIFAIAVLVFRHSRERRGSRSPIGQRLLRLPGHTLRKNIQELDEELFSAAAIVFAVSVYFLGYFSAKSSDTTLPLWAIIAFLSAAAVVLYFYFSRILRRLGTLRLGLDGELAVAEAATSLSARGYSVYHDIPGSGFNIDHVLVGPNGVFALETKARSKPSNHHKACFTGSAIEFPHYTDRESIEQARLCSKKLSSFLQRRCGRPLPVIPVVVIPGWYVEQKGSSKEIYVLASGQLVQWIPRIGGSLSEADRKSVSTILDELCRTEKPIAISRRDRSKFNQENVVP